MSQNQTPVSNSPNTHPGLFSTLGQYNEGVSGRISLVLMQIGQMFTKLSIDYGKMFTDQMLFQKTAANAAYNENISNGENQMWAQFSEGIGQLSSAVGQLGAGATGLSSFGEDPDLSLQESYLNELSPANLKLSELNEEVTAAPNGPAAEPASEELKEVRVEHNEEVSPSSQKTLESNDPDPAPEAFEDDGFVLKDEAFRLYDESLLDIKVNLSNPEILGSNGEVPELASEELEGEKLNLNCAPESPDNINTVAEDTAQEAAETREQPDLTQESRDVTSKVQSLLSCDPSALPPLDDEMKEVVGTIDPRSQEGQAFQKKLQDHIEAQKSARMNQIRLAMDKAQSQGMVWQGIGNAAGSLSKTGSGLASYASGRNQAQLAEINAALSQSQNGGEQNRQQSTQAQQTALQEIQELTTVNRSEAGKA